jgi:hypothetical protein
MKELLAIAYRNVQSLSVVVKFVKRRGLDRSTERITQEQYPKIWGAVHKSSFLSTEVRNSGRIANQGSADIGY